MWKWRTNRRAPVLLAAALALGCMHPPTDEPLVAGDDSLLSFAPVGPQTFVLESSPARLESHLRKLAETTGPLHIVQSFSNQWVQPPGWTTRVAAFGEVLPGDPFGDRGFPFRTNLVDPESGVVVLAYTRTPPGQVTRPDQAVQVSGRLEGWTRQGAGVLVLVNAQFESIPADPTPAG